MNLSVGKHGKSAGTDESVFRQVPVSGNGARVLPLEVVPVQGHGAQILLGHQQKAMFIPGTGT